MERHATNMKGCEKVDNTVDSGSGPTTRLFGSGYGQTPDATGVAGAAAAAVAAVE